MSPYCTNLALCKQKCWKCTHAAISAKAVCTAVPDALLSSRMIGWSPAFTPLRTLPLACFAHAPFLHLSAILDVCAVTSRIANSLCSRPLIFILFSFWNNKGFSSPGNCTVSPPCSPLPWSHSCAFSSCPDDVSFIPLQKAEALSHAKAETMSLNASFSTPFFGQDLRTGRFDTVTSCEITHKEYSFYLCILFVYIYLKFARSASLYVASRHVLNLAKLREYSVWSPWIRLFLSAEGERGQ